MAESVTKSVLGRLLTTQRKKLKLTQKEVAKMMGVSRRTYQRLEYGAGMELYDDAFKILDMKIIVLPKDSLL